MALASVVCASAGSLGVLLAGRALQAAGGAAGLAAAFVLLDGARRRPAALDRRCGARRRGGPALGGALTQAFDWRAIFVAQVPLAIGGALACWRLGAEGMSAAAARDAASGQARPPRGPSAFVALALVSAALLAVLFLLVLLLVAGWAVSPLGAAALVTVLPLAAFLGARYRAGDPRVCGGRRLRARRRRRGALAWLPGRRLAWTIPPQILAGIGMGLALPAFGGELLPRAHGARRDVDARDPSCRDGAGADRARADRRPPAEHEHRRGARARDRARPRRTAPAARQAAAGALAAERRAGAQPEGGTARAITANRPSFSGRTAPSSTRWPTAPTTRWSRRSPTRSGWRSCSAASSPSRPPR